MRLHKETIPIDLIRILICFIFDFRQRGDLTLPDISKNFEMSTLDTHKLLNRAISMLQYFNIFSKHQENLQC